jgi:hypothetical protein
MNIQAQVQAPHPGDRSQGREAESDGGDDERRGPSGIRGFFNARKCERSEVLYVIVPF